MNVPFFRPQNYTKKPTYLPFAPKLKRETQPQTVVLIGLFTTTAVYKGFLSRKAIHSTQSGEWINDSKLFGPAVMNSSMVYGVGYW